MTKHCNSMGGEVAKTLDAATLAKEGLAEGQSREQGGHGGAQGAAQGVGKTGGEAWEQRPQVGHATLEQKEGQ